MDAQQFAYWLQGFAELSGDAPPSKAQWKSIREHLGLVFKKVTPPVGIPPQKDLAEIMREIGQKPANPYRYPGTGDPFPLYPVVTCSIASDHGTPSVSLC